MFKIYKFILEFIKKPIINSLYCLNIRIVFDMNLFRIQGIIDINSLPSFYNNKLSRFLLQKETTINKLFELDDYDNKVQQKINNRLRIFIDNNNLMNYTGTRDDEACRYFPWQHFFT